MNTVVPTNINYYLLHNRCVRPRLFCIDIVYFRSSFLKKIKNNNTPTLKEESHYFYQIQGQ